jgi:hypothetical protein
MTREQLAHVLRAAARIAEDPDVVMGSQSILGTFPEDRSPAAVRCWQVGFRRCRPTPESCNASSIGSAAGTPAGMLAELRLRGSHAASQTGRIYVSEQDFIRVTAKTRVWSQFWSQFGVVHPYSWMSTQACDLRKRTGRDRREPPCLALIIPWPWVRVPPAPPALTCHYAVGQDQPELVWSQLRIGERAV